MTTNPLTRRRASTLAAALLLAMHAGLAVAETLEGTRILEAADHAELAAEMSADGVVRVALLDDRIARVIRLPETGFAVEHDPAAGDLYLRPVAETAQRVPGAPPASTAPPGAAAPQGPVALFVGSEKGSTYRLTLTPVAGGPAQILIRGVRPEPAEPAKAVPPAPEKDRVAAIAELIRGVARGTPPAGHVLEPSDSDSALGGIVTLEIWRGPRFEALVLALDAAAPVEAPELAGRLGPGVAAVWIGPAASRPSAGQSAAGGAATGLFSMGRLAVVVRKARGR